MVAGAVDNGRPQNRPRNAAPLDPALGFELGVNAGMLPRHLFAHRRAAQIQQPFRLTMRFEGINHMARPFGVYRVERILLFRLLNREAWELVRENDCVHSRDGRCEAAFVPDIAAHDLKAVIFFFVAGTGQQADCVAAFPQGSCGGKADKAAAAGN